MESIVLDILLIVGIVGYTVYGFRVGILRSAGAIAGIVAGAIAAWFVMPLVAGWITIPFLRIALTIAAGIALVGAGQALGSLIGRALRRPIAKNPLGALDRLAGGVGMAVIASLAILLLALGVSSLGVPLLSRAIAGSVVVGVIDSVTPDPVEAFLARIRATVVNTGIPRITDALGVTSPGAPDFDTATPELTAAAASVVRITGTAYQCGQNQTGTGFVIAPGRVVTNAHVVAGITDPVIETLGGGAVQGTIVYFDPIDDLAVIAADQLSELPLDLAPTAAAGTRTAVQGYPFGGPFQSTPAEVITVQTANVDDIYNDSANPREVYSLATRVEQGNSGGPLLTEGGDVVGVVFARGLDDDELGYAITMAELDPVAAQAPGLTEPVSTGACTRG